MLIITRVAGYCIKTMMIITREPVCCIKTILIITRGPVCCIKTSIKELSMLLFTSCYKGAFTYKVTSKDSFSFQFCSYFAHLFIIGFVFGGPFFTKYLGWPMILIVGGWPSKCILPHVWTKLLRLLIGIRSLRQSR